MKTKQIQLELLLRQRAACRLSEKQHKPHAHARDHSVCHGCLDTCKLDSLAQIRTKLTTASASRSMEPHLASVDNHFLSIGL